MTLVQWIFSTLSHTFYSRTLILCHSHRTNNAVPQACFLSSHNQTDHSQSNQIILDSSIHEPDIPDHTSSCSQKPLPWGRVLVGEMKTLNMWTWRWWTKKILPLIGKTTMVMEISRGASWCLSTVGRVELGMGGTGKNQRIFQLRLSQNANEHQDDYKILKIIFQISLIFQSFFLTWCLSAGI